MEYGKHGVLMARRWGRILCVAAAAGLVAGCATGDNLGKKPPAHCKRSDARPANPYGSVLEAKSVGTAPEAAVQGESASENTPKSGATDGGSSLVAPSDLILSGGPVQTADRSC